MKNLIMSLILISGVLCIPVRSNAAPLICQSVTNGITTLVPVLGTSCAAAFVAKGTSSVPGLTNGQCLQVISGDLGYGACGTVGGPTLAANQTWTGINTYTNASGTNFGTVNTNNLGLLNIAQGVGGGGSFVTMGADGSKQCAFLPGSFTGQDFVLMDVPNYGSVPLIAIDGSNNQDGLAFCQGFAALRGSFFGYVTTSGGAFYVSGATSGIDVPQGLIITGKSSSPLTLGTDSTKTCAGVNGGGMALGSEAGGIFMTQHLSSVGFCADLTAPSLNSQNGAQIGNTGATIILGQTGVPSGACVSGSIYTRSEGGAGSTLYGCYSATWHAATTP
jgi:hypothetical protein